MEVTSVTDEEATKAMGSGDVTSACAGVSFHNRAGGGKSAGWTAEVELGEVTRIGNADGGAHVLELA